MGKQRVKVFNGSHSSTQHLEKTMNEWLETGEYVITKCQSVSAGSSNSYIIVMVFYYEAVNLNNVKEFFKLEE